MLALFLLLSYILVCYGASNMVVYSNGPFHIFKKWRDFTNWIHPMVGELFSCMMCFPFWIGIILSIVDIFILKNVCFTPFNILIYSSTKTVSDLVFTLLFDGILSSGATWILHNIEEYYESNSKF